jgi:predicted Zn-dependent protease
LERAYFEPFGGRVNLDGSDATSWASSNHKGFTEHEHDDDLGISRTRSMNLKNDERAKQLFRKATQLRDAGRHDDAVATLQEILSEYPKSTAVLGTMGSVLYPAKRFSEARDYFVRVLTLRPSAELASLGLFHCLWALGDHAAARAEVVRFLTDNTSEDYNQLLSEMGWKFDSDHRRLIAE